MSKVSSKTYAVSFYKASLGKDELEIDNQTKRLVNILKKNGDLARKEEILREFSMLLDSNDSVLINVTAAEELDTDTIEEELASQLKKKVKINQEVDPSTIAGLKIRIGDKVWDNTLKNRLKILKKKLA